MDRGCIGMKLESVKAIIEALTGAEVRYLLAGGLAVIAHGYLRFTKDVDLIIQLKPDNIKRAFDALGRLGYRPAVPLTGEQFADPANRERWIREKDMKVFQLWSDDHFETPIDIFVAMPFDFNAEYEAAVRKPLSGNLEVRVVTIPALIAMKEEAGRPEDLIDIRYLRMRLDERGDD
jgi:hypothetical protein